MMGQEHGLTEKSIHDLELADFDEHPIWDTLQFDVAGGVDATVVPIPGKRHIDGTERLPYVRARGYLADGTTVTGIANVFTNPPAFQCPDLFIEGRWLVLLLPPAPPFVLAEQGPAKFAASLSKNLDQVFPITLWSEVTVDVVGGPIRAVFRTSGVEVA
jgi:hypothetical protein